MFKVVLRSYNSIEMKNMETFWSILSHQISVSKTRSDLKFTGARLCNQGHLYIYEEKRSNVLIGNLCGMYFWYSLHQIGRRATRVLAGTQMSPPKVTTRQKRCCAGMQPRWPFYRFFNAYFQRGHVPAKSNANCWAGTNICWPFDQKYPHLLAGTCPRRKCVINNAQVWPK